jgi:hypothetical protein
MSDAPVALSANAAEDTAAPSEIVETEIVSPSCVQQRDVVELDLAADAVDLVAELVDLGLDGAAVGRRERAVLVLHGQLANALQHRVDLVQRAFRRLHQRDGVLRVALSLGEAADLTTKLLADGESGRVVCCSIDPVAGGELLHRLLELVAVLGEHPVGVHRLRVALNAKRHS